MELLEDYLERVQEAEGTGWSFNVGGQELVKVNPGGEISVDGPTAAIAAGSVLALALISASAYFYRNFISKHGKQCRGYKGSDRARCIRKVQVVALEKRLRGLVSAKGKCKLSKNPEKCVAKVQRQITKLQNDLKVKRSSAGV